MKIIDIENSNRKKHFDFYNRMDYPHFNLTVPVDITEYLASVKSRGLPFFRCFLHAVTRTANSIAEFRQRIREGGTVIEHEIVHPSFTAIVKENVFSFCAVKYSEDLLEFLDEIEQKLGLLEAEVRIEDEPLDDRIFVSCIPWVSFTSIVHPVNMTPVDSVPRICWGKYQSDSGRIRMPLSIQAHHALMDGIHVGKFFSELGKILQTDIT